MKCFRIWSEDKKRCEAIWANYLLTILGCLSWKGRIEDEYVWPFLERKEFECIDIILCDEKCKRRFVHSLGVSSLSNVVICGVLDASELANYNYKVCGVCESLDISRPETIISLMDILSKIIAKDSIERESIMRLTKLFVSRENVLTKSIYTITEMFCSRRINYAEYQNSEILIRAVSEVESWIQELATIVGDVLTCAEMFAFIYLKNLIDEGYIKARTRGGYDTSIMFRNANFLLDNYREMEAVHFLKLQILHNSINFGERPDDILREMEREISPIYMSKAYSEVGDIYREENNRTSELPVIEYYEKMNMEDLENYQGIYRTGLVCEVKGSENFRWYIKALEKYNCVIRLIEKVDLVYRTPQEYEYFYKAQYGSIKMSIILDKGINCLTDERKKFYYENLNFLKNECVNYERMTTLVKLYGEQGWKQEISLLMGEKMNKVKKWIDDLIKEEL